MNLLRVLTVCSIGLTAGTAFMMLMKDKRGIPNISFVCGMLAIIAVEAGDLLTIVNPHYILLCKKVTLIGESLLPSFWLLFSLTYIRGAYKEIPFFWRIALALSVLPFLFVVSFPVGIFFYAPDIETEKILFLSNTGYYFYLVIVIYSVLTLINFESTLRASSGTTRWKIKHALIGIGGIMALLIYYYSQALLYRSIDMNLIPVRSAVIFICSLLIMVSLFRQTFQGEEIAVSRGIFYRSLVLVVVGIYLFGLGIVGTGMRYFGENTGKYLLIAIIFISGIILISILFSEELRRKVTVFISKNFYRNKYDYRSQWLQFTQRISSAKSFDALLISVLEGISHVIGTETQSLWLYNRTTESFHIVQPLDTAYGSYTVSNSNNLIAYCKEKGWIFNVKDRDRNTEIFDSNKDFFETTKASLIVPLLTGGNVIGFIILGRSFSNDEYNYEDYDILKTLARQASSAILSAKLSEELAEAREMEAMGRVSSFIIHDLKNLVYTLSMTSENAMDNMDNPEFQKDMTRTISNTVERMNRLIRKLSDMPKKVELNREKTDILELVLETAEPYINGKARITVESSEPVTGYIDRDEMRKVLVNLIINAMEASNDGEITIRTGGNSSMAYISVSDRGCGMSEEYVEKHLFRPFRSTKKKGLGIGLYQCKTVVEAHGGDIRVKSHEGEGTEFMIYLPVEETGETE
jgi:putative PEP-CTERM system histidine kinase